MITKGDGKPAAAITTPPSAARTFVAGDQLTAVVFVYVPATHAEMDLVAQVDWPDGSRNPPMRKKIAGGQGQSRTEEVAIPVNTRTLAPGRYVLRIVLDPGLKSRATGGSVEDRVARQVPFEIIAVP
jgi:hypothetical protein